MTITTIEATINAQLADLKSALNINILSGDDDRIKGCEFAIIELNILLETFEKQAKQKEEDDNTLKNEAFLSA
jgi:hypothetical protein